MATRLYLHAAAHSLSGTLPTGEQSTRTPTVSFDGATTLRKMDTTKGTSQTSFSMTVAQDIQHDTFIGMWVSPPLAAQTVVSSTLNDIEIGFALSESATTMNFGADIDYSLYVWRPSTGAVVTMIANGAAMTGEAEPSAANTQKYIAVVDTSLGVTASCQDGDVLILELWGEWNPGNADSVTATFYLDGTDETRYATNTTVSDTAAYMELIHDTLTFLDTGVTADASFTLGAATLSADASSVVDIALSKTLDTITLSTDVTMPITGDLSITLGAATLSSDALVFTDGEFTLDVTLGMATLSATGSVVVQADLSSTLGALTVASDATVQWDTREYSASITLGALTLVSAGVSTIIADLVATLGAATLSSTLEEDIILEGYMGLEVFVSDYTGALGDKVHNFLLANTTGTTASWTNQDLWMKFLTEKGYVTGTVQDRMRQFLLTYNAVADTGQTVEDLWSLITGPYVP